MSLRIALVAIWSLIAVGCQQESPQPAENQSGVLQVPVAIPGDFQLTLWGDAEQTQVDEQATHGARPEDPDGSSVRVSSRPGESAWGALYWQTRKAAGVRSPVKIEGATKLVFWARGELGGEQVQFKLAGEAASELLQPGDTTALPQEWSRFELPVGERDLSQVTGLFGVRWIQAGAVNPEGITFYLDDIHYE